MTEERVLFQFRGGPIAGSVRVKEMAYPPPEDVKDRSTGGHYKRAEEVRGSTATEPPEDVRGFAYDWVASGSVV